MMSVPPPAGNPTITCTGFFTVWARAGGTMPVAAERIPVAAPAAST
jgi:hypothetical protein